MKIQVTQEDIAVGLRANYRMCPIARAASRLLDEQVTVGYYHMGTANKSASLPPEASRFARDFDNYSVVYPFEFEIELVQRETEQAIPRED